MRLSLEQALGKVEERCFVLQSHGNHERIPDKLRRKLVLVPIDQIRFIEQTLFLHLQKTIASCLLFLTALEERLAPHSSSAFINFIVNLEYVDDVVLVSYAVDTIPGDFEGRHISVSTPSVLVALKRALWDVNSKSGLKAHVGVGMAGLMYFNYAWVSSELLGSCRAPTHYCMRG